MSQTSLKDNFDKRFNKYSSWLGKYDAWICKAYGLIIWQCTPNVFMKFKASKNKIEKEDDVLMLIKSMNLWF